MQNSRLISLIKSLSAGELKRFSQYVQTPYFNTHERLIRLTEYLQDCAPAFQARDLDKVVLFNVLYETEEGFQEQQVHDHFSMLLRLLRNFLAQEQFEKDPHGKTRYLLDALQEKGESQDFLRIYQNAISPQNAEDPFSFLESFQLTIKADPILTRERKRSQADPLSEAVTYLDLFYLSAKLKFSCEMLNRGNIINQEYHSEMLPEISLFLDKSGSAYLAHPILSIYNQVYRMLSAQEVGQHFQTLKSLLKDQSARLSRSEAYNAYAFALNYCVKQINRGQPRFLEELFDLYQELLKKELLIADDGYLPHEMVKNIVTTGLRLKRFSWVKNFLESSRTQIHPDHRENSYTYNLAALYYEQGQYRAALKLLQQVTFTDVFYDLGARSLQLKIYYELEEDDSLLYLVKAFRVFLKRNKDISPNQSRAYENLLRLANRSYKLKLKKGIVSQAKYDEQIKKLTQKIADTREIANVSWLREKVGEL